MSGLAFLPPDRRSVRKAQAQLYSSRRVVLAENCAERGTPDHDVRIIEAGGVGEVDEFPAELHIHAFTHLEILEYGRVEVVDSIAAQSRVITRRVSGNLVARVGEGAGIGKKAFAIHYLFDAETAARIAGDIGSLAAVSQAWIG